jgi:CheY-like chemotaxis protein
MLRFAATQLMGEVGRGTKLAIITAESIAGVDTRALVHWVTEQPPWSDSPFIVLTRHGGGALEVLARDNHIDLLLVDLAMPGMSGPELARRVKPKRPRLPILFVTGFADRAALEGVNEARTIGKPFIDSELVDKVRLTLAGDMPM